MASSSSKTPIPITDISAPAISKHVNSMAKHVDEPVEQSEDTIKETQQSNKIVEPPMIADKSTQDEVATPVATTSDTNNNQQSKEPEQPQTSEPMTHELDRYQAVDALPDPTKQHTTELTNAMEGPKIYDTTEYVVPISKTLHRHSIVGTVIAGLVSAAVVVALIYIAAITLT